MRPTTVFHLFPNTLNQWLEINDNMRNWLSKLISISVSSCTWLFLFSAYTCTSDGPLYLMVVLEWRESSYNRFRLSYPAFLSFIVNKKSPQGRRCAGKFFSRQTLMRIHWIFWCICNYYDFTTHISSKCCSSCYRFVIIKRGSFEIPDFGG